MLFVLLLAGLVLAALLFEWIGEWRDRRRYPAPGKVVSLLNGSRLHFHLTGEGPGPAVFLEAGIGGSSLGWAAIEPLLANSRRVISYDRAGLGWSGPCRVPRTVEAMTDEMSGVLAASGVVPPYILVGHSFGGLLIRAFACRFPEKTAGLIFVDPVTLAGWANAAEGDLRRIRTGARLSRRGALLARLGVVRMSLSLLAAGGRFAPKVIARASAGQGNGVIEKLVREVQKLPPTAQRIVRSHWSRPEGFHALADYLACLPASALAAVKMPIPPEVPFTVLSAANATPNELRERESWVAGSQHGSHVVVEGTGHWIQLEEPERVVQAVQELIR